MMGPFRYWEPLGRRAVGRQRPSKCRIAALGAYLDRRNGPALHPRPPFSVLMDEIRRSRVMRRTLHGAGPLEDGRHWVH